MSKIANDGLTRSGTGCPYSCIHMATVGVKGLTAMAAASSVRLITEFFLLQNVRSSVEIKEYKHAYSEYV